MAHSHFASEGISQFMPVIFVFASIFRPMGNRVSSGFAFTAAACFVLTGCAVQSPAQMTVTGTVSGTVVDPSSQVVPGATVTLTSEKTHDTRSITANNDGAFSFLAMQPDTYSIRVERSGFSAYQRAGVVLTANARLDLGKIQLAVGAVTETVNVQADSAVVQTDSSEQSAQLLRSSWAI